MTRGRWFALGACAAILGIVVVAAVRAPSWFAPPAADDPAVRVRGERLEQAVTSELTRVRADDPAWAVRVREADVNAWLATRLVPWTEHAEGLEWPSFVAGVQVHFTPDGAWIAVEREGGAPPRVAALRISPAVDSASLRVPITGARVGRIPVPIGTVLGDWTANWLDGAAGEELSRFVSGSGGVVEHALADGRRVRLVGFDIGDGWVDLAFETIAAAAAATTEAPDEDDRTDEQGDRRVRDRPADGNGALDGG